MLKNSLSPEIEARLRQNTPVLPPNLKNRTLARCESARRARQERRHRALQFAVAGVLGLQLLTLGRLDSQNARLLAGNGAPMSFASASVAEIAQSLRTRSRQLALLMAASKLG